MPDSTIPAAAFQALIKELEARPIPITRSRKSAGKGRSVVFGVVNRWIVPPDYSSMCWKRPTLYKLLLDFDHMHVCSRGIRWNSVTLNMNYRAALHRDRGNEGDSFVVAFGDFTGGALHALRGPLKGKHDITHQPIVGDFSRWEHEVLPFDGERFSLVYYYRSPAAENPLSPPSVRLVGGEAMFFRGEDAVPANSGLPHPNKKYESAEKCVPSKRENLSDKILHM